MSTTSRSMALTLVVLFTICAAASGWRSSGDVFQLQREDHNVSSKDDDALGGFVYEDVVNVPASVDWRAMGAVTPVVQQGSCNSCWACSATAALEGVVKIKTGKLIELSKQELVDCDTANTGCTGGKASVAFKYIKKNGVTTESSYPYTGVQGPCRSKLYNRSVATISGYQYVPANDEAALMKAVANQPVCASVEVIKGSAFVEYKGGIFKGPCGDKRTHYVTIVGYGTDVNGTDYWIIKNTWGVKWGENGYMRMQRGVLKGGLCGIAAKPLFPVL